jgi:hypothetical protein
LLEVLRYIHLNPVHSGLVNLVDEYPWSSHEAYLSNSARWGWLHKEILLSMLSPKSRRYRFKTYREFLSDPVSAETQAFFGKERTCPVFGDEGYIHGVQASLPSNETMMEEIAPKSLRIPDADEIIDLVALEYGQKRKALLSSRSGYFNEPRNVAIYLTRKLTGKRHLEIGKTFGLFRKSAVSAVIGRMKERLGKSREMQRRVSKLEDRANLP